jgi:hypothetical protein
MSDPRPSHSCCRGWSTSASASAPGMLPSPQAQQQCTSGMQLSLRPCCSGCAPTGALSTPRYVLRLPGTRCPAAGAEGVCLRVGRLHLRGSGASRAARDPAVGTRASLPSGCLHRTRRGGSGGSRLVAGTRCRPNCARVAGGGPCRIEHIRASPRASRGCAQRSEA